MGVRRFLNDRRAVTSLEYALIGGLIFLAIVSGVQLFTGNVSTMYNSFSVAIGTKLKGG